MSLQVIVTGKITMPPQIKTSQNGNDYAFCLLSAPTDQGRISVSVFAFLDHLKAQLMALGKNDEVALSGNANLSHWEQDGEMQCSLSITPSQIMSIYQFRRKQKKVRETQSDEFNDSVDDI